MFSHLLQAGIFIFETTKLLSTEGTGQEGNVPKATQIFSDWNEIGITVSLTPNQLLFLHPRSSCPIGDVLSLCDGPSDPLLRLVMPSTIPGAEGSRKTKTPCQTSCLETISASANMCP